METTSYAAPNGHARIATRSVAGGSVSLLRYRNYKDFAPPELVIDSTTSTADSHVAFFNYLLKMPALVVAR